MAIHAIQSSFARGEISPRLFGRVDLGLYRIALEMCRNCIIYPQGTIANAPGTRFIAAARDQEREVRVWPFEFSTEDAYVMEAGERYFRFFKDDGIVVAEPTDAVVTNGNFDTDLSGWTVSNVTWQNGQAKFAAASANFIRQQITIDAAYVGKKHVLSFSTSGFATGVLTFRVGTTAGGSEIFTETLEQTAVGYYTRSFTPTQTTFYIDWSGDADAAGVLDSVFFFNDEPIVITTPYRAAEVFGIHLTQSADVLYLAHRGRAPAKLTRTDNDAWLLTQIKFTDQPSEWVADNYPQRVGFFEDRLCWAATPKEPQTTWLSKVGDYEVLTIPGSSPTDEDALKLTISAGQVNAIQWLVEEQQLQIGTSGATRTFGGAGVDEPLTGTSIKQKRHSTFGASSRQPIQVGAVTLYLGRFNRRLREFFYSFDIDRYVSPDVTLLSEHLTKSGVADIAYTQDPDSMIWMVTQSGTLVGLTYERDQEVAAFHVHDTDGFYESVAAIPGPDREELWCVVRRTIGGVTKRYIEQFQRAFDVDLGDTVKDAFFVHSGLTYDGRGRTEVLTLSATTGTNVTVTAAAPGLGATESAFNPGDVNNRIVNENGAGIGLITQYVSPTEVRMNVEEDFASITLTRWTNEANAVSGLDHLEGKTIALLVDGATSVPQMVVSGSITLPDGRTAGVIHAGLPFIAKVKTLRLSADLQDGTLQGRKKLVHEVIIRLRNTLGMSFGPDESNLQRLVFRQGGQPMDAPPPLFTGDKQVGIDQGWDRAGQVTMIQDQPLPMEIQAVIPRVSIGQS